MGKKSKNNTKKNDEQKKNKVIAETVEHVEK